jgi:hypothetical protein
MEPMRQCQRLDGSSCTEPAVSGPHWFGDAVSHWAHGVSREQAREVVFARPYMTGIVPRMVVVRGHGGPGQIIRVDVYR